MTSYENNCEENLPADWHLECSDECIYDDENDADGDDICGDDDEKLFAISKLNEYKVKHKIYSSSAYTYISVTYFYSIF